MTVVHTTRDHSEADTQPVVVIASDGPAAERAAVERARRLFGPEHEHVVVGRTSGASSAPGSVSARSVSDIARARGAVSVVLGVTVRSGDSGRPSWLVEAVRLSPCPVVIVTGDG